MKVFVLVISVLVLTVSSSAVARITGLAVNHCAVISPPASVDANAIDVAQLRCFDEQQSVVLTQNLAVDAPGGAVSVIIAGTTIASHYVVWDPLFAGLYAGTIALDRPVIGVISSTNGLAASDFLGAPPPTTYGGPFPNRGQEPSPLTEGNTTNGMQVSVFGTASSPGDAIRVITLPSAACDVIIDFEALQNGGSGGFPVTQPYIEDGFQIDELNGDTLSVLGTSTVPQFSGSTAVIGPGGLGELRLTQLNGVPFDICSMDATELSSANVRTMFPVYGTRADGSWVVDNFQLDGDGSYLPQRVSFASQTNISEALFQMSSGFHFPGFYQLDNICICNSVVKCVPPPSGLVAWWTGDDCLGHDRLGDHNGSYSPLQACSNPTGIVRPRPLTFDSGQSQILTVPANPALEPGTGAFSLDLWVKPTAADLVGFVPLVGKGAGFQLGLNAGVPVLKTEVAPDLVSSVGASLVMGEWHFLGFTVKGRKPPGGDVMTLYDGTVSTSQGFPPDSAIESISDLHIGGDPVGMVYFDGEMDEIEVFDRELSALEMATLHGASTFGKCKDADSVSFAGTGTGGSINIELADASFDVVTNPGDSAADVAEAVASVIQTDAGLLALGITALAVGDEVVIAFTPVSSLHSNDPGIIAIITHAAASVPAFAFGGLVVLATLLAASAFILSARRKRHITVRGD